MRSRVLPAQLPTSASGGDPTVISSRTRWLSALLVAVAVVAAAATSAGAATRPPRPRSRPLPTLIVAPAAGRGTVSPNLYGANLLWPNGAGGAFDPSTDSFSPGVVALIRRLGIRAIRYPGGTTADSFHWRRAIGPLADRRPNEPYGMQARAATTPGALVDAPTPSLVGPDEFGHLLLQSGAVGDVVVNFATGSAREAADFVAYLTAPVSTHPSTSPTEPSYWAALRAANGHRAPYPVPYFEVGNEQQVPAEYGWRSGQLVALGSHQVRCPPGATASCLYVFGGITRFTNQPVGTYADDLPGAALSRGVGGQRFFAYYPPVVPGSEKVEVNGVPWYPVQALSAAAPGAHVFTFNAPAGRIAFGDGAHGAIPPAGSRITMSYESGPHAGFVGFYTAMKQMDPAAQICESEGQNQLVLRLLGRAHPYDCIVFHAYAVPRDVRAPLSVYEQSLMSFAPREGADLARLQQAAQRLSGHRVPIAVTEYGQPVAPMPVADPGFDLSMDAAVLAAAQLRQWIDHGVALADKYVLVSSPLAATGDLGAGPKGTVARTVAQRTFQWIPGLRINSAMIADAGRRPVVEPTGLVLGLLGHLAGGHLLGARVLGGPLLAVGHTPALLPVAVLDQHGRVELAVVNTSPTRTLRARLVLAGGLAVHGPVHEAVLDGPSATAYNTTAQPDLVHVTTRTGPLAPGGVLTFPAHSVSLLRLG